MNKNLEIGNIDKVKQFLNEEIALEAFINLRQLDDTDKTFLLKTLWEIILSNKHPEAWRSAWTFFHIAHNDTHLTRPYIQPIVDHIQQFKHDGQKRELLKILLSFKATELPMGQLLEVCYNFLLNEKESLAVRVHSMEMIYQISEVEPDLKPELKLVLEALTTPDASPAITSRAGKILKNLQR